MNKVLIIEDEINIARLIELELKREGFSVSICHDGKSGLEKALLEEFDIILLDIMLPKLNGFDVLSKLREKKTTPVIILTAKDEIPNRVFGLNTGADDYVIKPFNMSELVARIKSNLRRNATPQPQKTEYEINGLKLTSETCSVYYNDNLINLTKKEYELLLFLMKNQGKVVSRAEIIKNVWGFDFVGDTNLVDVYIRFLRSKIDDRFKTDFIKTVRGFGYTLNEN